MYDGKEYFVKGPDGRFLFRTTGSSVEWADTPAEATAMDPIRVVVYASSLDGTVHPGHGQVISVSAVDLQRAAMRDMVLTIRRGRRDYDLGPTLLHNRESGAFIEAEILRISFCLLRNVPQVDLVVAGHSDHHGLLDELREFYPDLTSDEEVTIVRFDVHV